MFYLTRSTLTFYPDLFRAKSGPVNGAYVWHGPRLITSYVRKGLFTH